MTHLASDLDFRNMLVPGDMLMWSHGTAEPIDLIRSALASRPADGSLSVFLGGSYSDVLASADVEGLDIHGMGAVGTNRDLCAAGRMRVHPFNLSQLPAILQDGTIPVSVVLIQCGPEQADASPSIGAVNSYARYAIPRARMRVAEINEAAPRTHSRHPIDVSRFDRVVRVNRPLVEIKSAAPSGLEIAIGNHAGRYIKDGDTVQIGIGTMPSAILSALGNHRHLGLHTGVLGDEAMALLKNGVIDNSRKSIDRGLSVAGALSGSHRLLTFAHDNPDLLIEPVHYTHAISTLARIDNLVAINSAIEVDLTGQVGAEIAGTRYLGTIGGLGDFVRGALASAGGRSLICLPSRTPGGKPRIVARMASGIVTVARADADIVVTEWGSAQLRGQSTRERIRRLIAIAHPDDRDDLSDAARNIPG